MLQQGSINSSVPQQSSNNAAARPADDQAFDALWKEFTAHSAVSNRQAPAATSSADQSRSLLGLFQAPSGNPSSVPPPVSSPATPSMQGQALLESLFGSNFRPQTATSDQATGSLPVQFVSFLPPDFLCTLSKPNLNAEQHLSHNHNSQRQNSGKYKRFRAQKIQLLPIRRARSNLPLLLIYWRLRRAPQKLVSRKSSLKRANLYPFQHRKPRLRSRRAMSKPRRNLDRKSHQQDFEKFPRIQLRLVRMRRSGPYQIAASSRIQGQK